jgi:hypothetical protein
MQKHTIRINPSEETIKIGPLGSRFLLTGDDSNGNASVFEVIVPVGQKLMAPAHKNLASAARSGSLAARPLVRPVRMGLWPVMNAARPAVQLCWA